MASLDIDDNGAMAAVFGPLAEIERIVAEADGYVVVANVNSNNQAVIGGATEAVERVDRDVPGGRLHGAADSGQPRVPHLDRRAGQRAAEGGRCADSTCTPHAADRRQRDGRVLPRGRRRRDDGRHPRPPGRITGAVRQGPAHAVRRWCAGVRRGRPEEGAARVRRRRVRAGHDDVVALFTNHPKLGDATCVQPGPVRSVRRRPRPARPSASPAPRQRPIDAAATRGDASGHDRSRPADTTHHRTRGRA